MKKKIFGILLSLAMVVTMMSAMTMTAWASGEPHSHGDVTFENAINNLEELTNLFSNGGSGYLAENITATSGLTVSNNVSLDLKGKVLNLDGKGNITVNNGVSFNLYDCDTTTEHKFGDTNGLWTWDDTLTGEAVKHTVIGGVITGGNATEGGGVYNFGTFNMFGGSIVGNTATSYGGGVLNSVGTFTLDNGEIIGNTASQDGGGVYVNSNSTFTMREGKISSNKASNYGGCVFMNSNSSFTMENGEISGNAAKNGGGVYVNSGCTFTMKDGEISGNEATENGGGVINFGTFTMENGEISGNKATKNGGGVFVNDNNNCTFTMKDGEISGNKAIEDGGGVANYGTFTMDNGEISDNTAKYSGGVDNNGTFTIVNGEISGNSATSYGGGVYNNSTFTMKGGKISDNIAPNGSGVMNFDGTSKMEDGEINGNKASNNGGGVYVNKGTFTMENGEISGNGASNSGGGLYNNSTFTMKGGIISDNDAPFGSGVMNFDGTSKMEDGKISDNKESNYGGGVYVYNGSFTMKDGEISDNKASTYGGGVYVNTGSLKMENGEISSNAAKYGGGVMNYGGTFTMENGEISGNAATSCGGGVFNNSNKTFTMKGGKISDNTASEDGGGVENYGIFTMENGEIIGNTASGYGGGVDVYNGSFTMKDGKISGNAAKNGGGVYIASGTLKLLATQEGEIRITGNTATNSVGGVVNKGTMYLSGSVVIKDNICTNKYDGKINYPINLATINQININEALTGSEIYLTCIDSNIKHNTGVLTSGYTDNNTSAGLNDFFHYDGASYYSMIKNSSGELEVVSNWSLLAKAMSGESDQGVDGFFKVTKNKPNTGTNTITLLSDITATSGDLALVVPNGKKVVLDLNGHVLDRGLIAADGTKTQNDHGSVIEVCGELTIKDSVPTTQHAGFVDANGLWHLAADGHPTADETSKTIKGGIITGGTGLKVVAGETQYQGGGIIVCQNGKATMERGTIAGNSAEDNGGGIMIQDYSEFIMLGGNITNNCTYDEDGAGGGIWNGGKCELNGGTITDNSSIYGGGCYNTNNFILGKSSITGNKAKCGGGIYNFYCNGINSNAQISISGADGIVVKNNTSTSDDGYNIATDREILINTTFTNVEMYVTFNNSDDDETKVGQLTSGYKEKNPNAKLDDFFHYDGPSTYYMDWNDGNTELVVNQVPSGKNAISIPSIPNGKVTADKQIASAGATVTLTVTPNSGYELSVNSLKVTSVGGTLVPVTGSGNTYTFTMPAGAVKITATFKVKSGGGDTPGGETTDEPKTEEYKAQIEGENTVDVNTTITDGKAKVDEISKSTLEEAVNPKSGTETTDTILIDLSQAKQDVTAVELTKSTVENLADVVSSDKNAVETVTIQMKEATVELDAKTLETISEEANGNTIILVVDKTQSENLTTAKQETLKDYNVNKTFEAYFESNGHRIHDFKGGVATVSIKFEPTQGSDVNNYKIYYLDDNAKMHKYATKYKDGMLVFATTHFSDYVIVYEGKTDVLLAQAKSSKGKIKLSWNGIDNATKYVVYGARCGHNYKKLKTTTGKSYTVKKVAGKKLKAHKAYKFYVVSYDAVGNKVKSRSIHYIYKNTQGKYANVKSIKTKVDELLLGIGRTHKLGATYKMYSGKKHIKKTHGAALRYTSTNPEVAKVSSSGKVTAVSAGIATIYIQDIGGKYCKTKVTVN